MNWGETSPAFPASLLGHLTQILLRTPAGIKRLSRLLVHHPACGGVVGCPLPIPDLLISSSAREGANQHSECAATSLVIASVVLKTSK